MKLACREFSLKPEDVLAADSRSSFSWDKDGLVLTADGIYGHELNSDRIDFREGRSFGPLHMESSSVKIRYYADNGGIYLQTHVSPKKQYTVFNICCEVADIRLNVLFKRQTDKIEAGENPSYISDRAKKTAEKLLSSGDPPWALKLCIVLGAPWPGLMLMWGNRVMYNRDMMTPINLPGSSELYDRSEYVEDSGIRELADKYDRGELKYPDSWDDF